MPIRFDGVIEAVRYASDGKIEVVRAYERRGAAFSDHVLIGRAALVERLKQGKKFVTGQRKPNLGGMFEIGASVALKGDVITTQPDANHDFLDAVPVF
jgi:acetyl-CoA carboxylase beta subunit